MERKIVKYFKKWKESKNRMPLLVYGARQVGKTFIVLEFGKTNYSNTVYFNFEGNAELDSIFSKDLNISRIINELSVITGEKIIKKETLIFFDEIQASEKALTSLKYFYENEPEYHIIAAGSLLGTAVNRKNFSFPVGKIDMITMYSLDFEEYLWATENKVLSEMINEHYEKNEPLSKSLHEKALELYRTYLIVGGMPNVINSYLEQKDFNFVKAMQNNILNAYTADMAKYATPAETVKCIAAFDSLTAQLAKENKKFQFALIKSGARAKDYEISLNWLNSSGIVIKCNKVKDGLIPLKAFTDVTSFKIYFSDVGLYSAKANLPVNMIISNNELLNYAKGNLAENYVAQQLTINIKDLFYWESEGKAELDFLYQDNEGRIVPIETKSGENVKAKSLALFIKKYNIDFSIRISARNFGFENNIKSVPLYAVFCIK